MRDDQCDAAESSDNTGCWELQLHVSLSIGRKRGAASIGSAGFFVF